MELPEPSRDSQVHPTPWLDPPESFHCHRRATSWVLYSVVWVFRDLSSNVTMSLGFILWGRKALDDDLFPCLLPGWFLVCLTGGSSSSTLVFCRWQNCAGHEGRHSPHPSHCKCQDLPTSLSSQEPWSSPLAEDSLTPCFWLVAQLILWHLQGSSSWWSSVEVVIWMASGKSPHVSVHLSLELVCSWLSDN